MGALGADGGEGAGGRLSLAHVIAIEALIGTPAGDGTVGLHPAGMAVPGADGGEGRGAAARLRCLGSWSSRRGRRGCGSSRRGRCGCGSSRRSRRGGRSSRRGRCGGRGSRRSRRGGRRVVAAADDAPFVATGVLMSCAVVGEAVSPWSQAIPANSRVAIAAITMSPILRLFILFHLFHPASQTAEPDGLPQVPSEIEAL